MKCQVASCGRSDKSHPGLHFYRFPKDPAVRREWIKACVVNKEYIPYYKPSPHSRLCSLHFPNGKKNADGTINIPVHVDTLDEEMLQMDVLENVDAIDDQGDDSGVDGQFGVIQEIEEGEELLNPVSSQIALTREVLRLRGQVAKLKRSVHRWRCRYSRLAALKNNGAAMDGGMKIFNEDQRKLLSGKVRRVSKWSEATVLDSLQIRFACQGGYDKLIKRGYPLPSTRTLLRRIEVVRFAAGILEDIFELFKCKVAGMSAVERDCGLVLDEMSIDEKEDYCSSTKQLVGKTTLPPSDSLASKALVLMIVGIAERWKQVVAYAFTTTAGAC